MTPSDAFLPDLLTGAAGFVTSPILVRRGTVSGSLPANVYCGVTAYQIVRAARLVTMEELVLGYLGPPGGRARG